MPAHLLVADDEPSLLALLRMYFERMGYRVSGARDGEEAIALARSARPDLLILDIQMPRKTGIEVAQELRGDPSFAQTPMIAFTAHVRDYLPPAVRKAGFNQLLTKPFEFEELSAAVAELLEGRG